MKNNHPNKNWEWLQSMPSHDELCAAYPKEWDVVQSELATIFEQGKAEELKIYLDRSLNHVASLTRTSKLKPGDKKAAEAVLSQYVKNRMANLAVSKCSLAVVADANKGKKRFNLFNGFIAQKLLFAKAFERKPVPLFWFRLFWPLLWQRKMLMPLVQPRGIYCFYSRPLIEALSKMIGSRSCLEIGAGDGTLSRFIKDQGVDIIATDNYGWKHAVQYSTEVIKLDAIEALKKYAPEVVLCSWPPANNTFERELFKIDSVQLYIVISSRHQFASGNWPDYLSQTMFSLEEDKKLSSLVLPPELESAVYVFRRKVE